MIEKVLEVIGSYDSDFPARVVGASRREIGLLEELVQMILPSAYREFLEKMGAHPGGLVLRSECSTKIAELIEIYRIHGPPPSGFCPEGCLMIAGGGLADVSLDLRAGGEPPVVISSGGLAGERRADSLETMLLKCGFWQYNIKRFPHYGHAEVPLDFAAARKALEAKGFKERPGTDSLSFCASSSLGSASLGSSIGKTLFLTAGADTPEKLEEIKRIVVY